MWFTLQGKSIRGWSAADKINCRYSNCTVEDNAGCFRRVTAHASVSLSLSSRSVERGVAPEKKKRALPALEGAAVIALERREGRQDAEKELTKPRSMHLAAISTCLSWPGQWPGLGAQDARAGPETPFVTLVPGWTQHPAGVEGSDSHLQCFAGPKSGACVCNTHFASTARGYAAHLVSLRAALRHETWEIIGKLCSRLTR